MTTKLVLGRQQGPNNRQIDQWKQFWYTGSITDTPPWAGKFRCINASSPGTKLRHARLHGRVKYQASQNFSRHCYFSYSVNFPKQIANFPYHGSGLYLRVKLLHTYLISITNRTMLLLLLFSLSLELSNLLSRISSQSFSTFAESSNA